MDNKLTQCLLYLRISIALVLIMWTVDKLVNPAHGIRVFEHFYFISGVEEQIMMAIGVIELVLIALFVVGRYKHITYLIVLIIHAVSTVTPMMNYFDPFSGSNLLFFAAWPMLAACWMLYAFREQDTKFNF